MATTLQNHLHPTSSNPFTNSSLSHKLNISQTHKVRLQTLREKFCYCRATTPATQKNQLTDFSPLAKTTNHPALKAEANISFDKYISLSKSSPLSDCRQIHAQLVKMEAFGSNNIAKNKLATEYARSAEFLDHARKSFDEIPDKTVQTYASLLRSYCRLEKWVDLFSVFSLMVYEDLLPNKYIIPTILKACSAMNMMRSGKMIHGHVVRNGLASDIFVGNALIDLYANCGDLRYSVSVFDSMETRDVVSWTALVSAYMEEGLLDEAEEVFHSMNLNGVKPDLISWNALVSGFARNGEIELALKYLHEMQERGMKPRVNSWNGIISGFVQSGHFEDALYVFNEMLQVFEDPNFITIASILPSCAAVKDPNLGRAIHGYALKCELCENLHVQGSLINMYSRCDQNDNVKKVFVDAKNKNTNMWNEIISAYVNNGKMEVALGLLRKMQNDGFKTDVVTYNTMLAGYARNRQKKKAYELLSEMIRAGLKPNIITFNTLVSGFQQSGLTHEALKSFRAIQSLSVFSKESPQPNSITLTGALAACADLRTWHQGKEIHAYILRNGFAHNIYVLSSVVDMYMKCHDMVSATNVFWRIEERNAICWSALIAGYINNKQLKLAFGLFHEMMVEGIDPSSIIIAMLLQACGDMVALRWGKELHGYIVKCLDVESHNAMTGVLVNMYAKCQCITETKLV